MPNHMMADLFEPILPNKQSEDFDETLQMMEGNPYENSRIITIDEKQEEF